MLSWCKKELSTDPGHRVTFGVDASYAALRSAYNSYIKHSDKNNTSAKEKKLEIRYLAEAYYQVWDGGWTA